MSFSTLQSAERSPLDDGRPLTTEEISWIVSLFCAGGFIGTVCFGATSNAVGRKTYLMLLAIPQAMSWLLIIFATDVSYLYVSRVLAGMSGGGCYVIAPLLIADISEDR